MKKLLEVMEKLRSEEGCPWDREQTLSSLSEFLIEEAYELEEAMLNGDFEAHCEELGDLLLQIAFQCTIAKEKGNFSYEDVEKRICSKMIERHPHVFSDAVARDSADVLKIWNKSKKKKYGSVTAGIPVKLPALMKASKVYKRLSNVDESFFNKNKIESSFDIKSEEEAGKFLFDFAAYCKEKNIEPERALNNFIKNKLI
ncbi:MAG: MazG nucleotide pyrophosphohydrolase domain-containing protein [Candidatus Muiribacteriota bacterium]